MDVLPESDVFEGRVDKVLSALAALRRLGNVKVDFLFRSTSTTSAVGAVVTIAGVSSRGGGGVTASACSFAVRDNCESEACLSFRRLNLCRLGGCRRVSTSIVCSCIRSGTLSAD